MESRTLRAGPYRPPNCLTLRVRKQRGRPRAASPSQHLPASKFRRDAQSLTKEHRFLTASNSLHSSCLTASLLPVWCSAPGRLVSGSLIQAWQPRVGGSSPETTAPKLWPRPWQMVPSGALPVSSQPHNCQCPSHHGAQSQASSLGVSSNSQTHFNLLLEISTWRSKEHLRTNMLRTSLEISTRTPQPAHPPAFPIK